jgi:hypothetical protein
MSLRQALDRSCLTDKVSGRQAIRRGSGETARLENVGRIAKAKDKIHSYPLAEFDEPLIRLLMACSLGYLSI